MIRILLVDDSPFIRDGIAAALQPQDDMTVIGACSDGLEAVEMAEATRPDVVLMDLQMPGLSGIEATVRLLARQPRVRVIILTAHPHGAATAAAAAGAVGLIPKTGDVEQLLRAIRTVAAGGTLWSGDLDDQPRRGAERCRCR